MCGIVELIAPVLGAPSIQLVVRVDPECAVLGSVLPSCPGHVPPVSVRRIARAPDVDCITSLSQCVLCPIVWLMPARVVLWARVQPIAHTHNVAQPEMFHVDLTSAQPEMFHVDLTSAPMSLVDLTSAQPMFHVDLTSAQRLLCVGSLLVQNELIRNAVPGVARCIVRVHVAHSMRPQMGWGREPDEHRSARGTPNNALSLATLNVRRLWLQDESVHDGFHMFCAILNSENVAVCCIQEPRAGAKQHASVVSQWKQLFSVVHSHSWCPRHCLDAVAQFPGHDMCVFLLRSPHWAP